MYTLSNYEQHVKWLYKLRNIVIGILSLNKNKTLLRNHIYYSIQCLGRRERQRNGFKMESNFVYLLSSSGYTSTAIGMTPSSAGMLKTIQYKLLHSTVSTLLSMYKPLPWCIQNIKKSHCRPIPYPPLSIFWARVKRICRITDVNFGFKCFTH